MIIPMCDQKTYRQRDRNRSRIPRQRQIHKRQTHPRRVKPPIHLHRHPLEMPHLRLKMRPALRNTLKTPPPTTRPRRPLARAPRHTLPRRAKTRTSASTPARPAAPAAAHALGALVVEVALLRVAAAHFGVELARAARFRVEGLEHEAIWDGGPAGLLEEVGEAVGFGFGDCELEVGSLLVGKVGDELRGGRVRCWGAIS